MKRAISMLLVFCMAAGLLLIRFNGMTAYAQDNFVWSKKAINRTNYYGVAYGNNLYVMVAGDGSIRTSPDAKEWTKRASPTTNELRDIVWNGSIFVAVGDKGTVITSPDGISWTSIFKSEDSYLKDIIWDGKQFILVGSNKEKGVLLTTKDLHEWYSYNSPKLNGIAYNGECYVGVGEDGKFVHSSYGYSWSEFQSCFYDSLYKVTWDGQRFIAVGDDGEVIVAEDGMNWEKVDSGCSKNLYDIVHENGKTIAVGENGTVLYSTDGVNWERRNLDTGTFNRIIFQYGNFLILGMENICISEDGNKWSSYNSIEKLYSAIWTGEKFLVAGKKGTVITSTDGILWDEKKIGPSNVNFYSAAFGAGTYVVVGAIETNLGNGQTKEDGVIYISKDGVNWNEQKVTEGESLNSIACNGEVFIAVGINRCVLTSKDGIVWSQIEGITGIHSVYWEGNKFLAFTNSQKVFISTDTVSWEEYNLKFVKAPATGDSNEYYVFNSITYNGSIFVGVGPGIIATSADGITWDTFETPHYLSDVIWTGEQFMVVGAGGMVTSPDAKNWTTVNLGAYYLLYGIAWSGSKIVAVGLDGTVLTGEKSVSPPTPPPGVIKIISPENGSQLNYGTVQGPGFPIYSTSIPIKVRIKEIGKTISKVEFYSEDRLLGFSDTSPYTFELSYPLRYPGTSETFKAKVIYTDGTFAESPISAVRIHVAHVDDFSRVTTMPPRTNTPTPTCTPIPVQQIKISGYIKPDHISNDEASSIKSGFIVQVDGRDVYAYTDNNGFFEISVVNNPMYALSISKPGYLKRNINKVNGSKDIQISSKDSPLELWAGDVEINQHQDNAVNMIDIMEIAKGFNTVIGNERYNSSMDYNKDNAINMTDIIIVAKNFNKVQKDYPSIF